LAALPVAAMALPGGTLPALVDVARRLLGLERLAAAREVNGRTRVPSRRGPGWARPRRMPPPSPTSTISNRSNGPRPPC
jgi:hypothetical protein